MLVAVVAAAIVVLYFTSGVSGSGEAGSQTGLAAQGEQAPARLDGGWDRIDLPGTARFSDVWDVDGRLYAGGRHPQIESAVVWRSDDGRDWTEVDDGDGSLIGSTLHDFVSFEGATLAIGTRQVGAEGAVRVIPAVWRLAGDGRLFLVPDALAPGEQGLPDGGSLLDATVHDGRLLVAGWAGNAFSDDDTTGATGAIWVSDDGEHFEPAVVVGDAFTEPGTVVRRIATAQDGGLLAVGEQAGSPAVWRSEGGSTWTRVALGPTPRSGVRWRAGSLVSGPNGTFALAVTVPVSATSPVEVEMWSADSDTWATLDPAAFDDAGPSSIDGDAVGYVAAGNVDLGEGRTTGALWVSADTAGWSRVVINDMVPGASRVSGVAVFDGGVAVVGEVYEQPAIWFRQAGVLEAEQPVTAAGPLAPPTWATVFQEQSASGASPVSIMQVAGRLYGFAPERVMWTSESGVEWTPARFDEVGLADAEAISSIVFRGGVYVAVGEEDGTGLWVSRDGLTWGRPSLAPPCCVRAVVHGEVGFVAFLERSDGWELARSEDGFRWEVDERAVPFPVDVLWETASVGQTWMVWGSAAGDERIRLWVTVGEGGWVETQGPDGAFTNVSWEGVWELDDRVVVTGEVGPRSVVYATSDGLGWESIRIPGAGRAPDVRDVATIPDGLAVMLVVDGRLIGVATVVDGRTTDLIELDPDEGFGGLRAVLIPGTDALRTVGPDHGRMTVWEWIP